MFVAPAHLQHTMVLVTHLQEVLARPWQSPMVYTVASVWGKDAEDQSSNYCKLPNLVETVEEEAMDGYLTGGDLWLFTDNATAKGCFFQGGSSSKLLHELVLWLRKTELEYDLTTCCPCCRPSDNCPGHRWSIPRNFS